MTSSSVGESIDSFCGRLHELGVITVLPDYFEDRFVRFKSFEDLSNRIKRKGAESGGGSLRGIVQDEVKGGNAVNIAYALGKMGASVNAIAIANDLAAETLRTVFSRMERVTLHVIDGKCGYTVALEYEESGRHVNVMLSDTGDLRDFDGSRITQWDAVANSKIVAVVNWAANRSGNELCDRVFRFAHANGVRTFFDPADVSEVTQFLPEFKRKILDDQLADIISLNDNEARFICKSLCNHLLPQDYSEADLREASRRLSDLSAGIVDIHTRKLSVTCEKSRDSFVAPSHKVEQKIVTGAGDVWDAADLVGHLSGVTQTERLSFANAAAGLYVSTVPAAPPSFADTLEFRNALSQSFN